VAQFSEEVRDGQSVVRVAGDLDLAAVEDFVQVVESCLGRSEGVELDLAGVSFIDSSGLGALVRSRKAAEAQSKTLRLSNVNEPTQRLLNLTGLAEVFDIRTSLD